MASSIKEAFYPESFDFEYMMSLPTFRRRIEYVSESLPKIGSGGTSRVAFKVDGATVLKVSKNKAGVSQSLGEIKLGKLGLSCCAKVYDHSRDGSFLEMEYVVSFHRYAQFYTQFATVDPKDAFAKFTGLLPMSIPDLLMAINDGEDLEETIDDMGKYENGDQWELPPHAQAWVRDVHIMMKEHEVGIGDLDRPDHWGWVYRDGILTPVCLDFGFNTEVYVKHYMGDDKTQSGKSNSKVPAIKTNNLPVSKVQRSDSYYQNYNPANFSSDEQVPENADEEIRGPQ